MTHISISTVSKAADGQLVSSDQCHSVWKTIVLHLFPGALITAFFFLSGPVLIRAGFPPIMSLYLAILLILIPFELGYLLYQGKKLNGSYSLEGVILFRERTPIWQMVLLIAILFGWSGLVFSLVPKLDTFITHAFFTWFPSWSFTGNLLGNSSQYSKTVLIITVSAGFILNGVAGPVVEELYFRGYLLPRMPFSRSWAPLINVVLFSLYHFFSPWQNLTRILAFLPLIYAAAWKRNITISIWAHCLFNIAGMILTFALIL